MHRKLIWNWAFDDVVPRGMYHHHQWWFDLGLDPAPVKFLADAIQLESRNHTHQPLHQSMDLQKKEFNENSETWGHGVMGNRKSLTFTN